jgi:predicted dehydrogenase
LGQGRSGKNIHTAHLKDDERFAIAAVVDPIAERCERSARELNCDGYASHEPLLERKDIDLIVNAAPSKFHTPLSLEFLKAGFNVLCDKPLANRAADADRLIAAAEESGKTLAIFQQSRYAPYFRQVRSVIDSGVLGEIVQVNISFSGFSRRYDWQTLIDEMGGALLNTGPHPLDQALRFFDGHGEPEVSCQMRRAVALGDAEDHCEITLTARTAPVVRVEISSCAALQVPTYYVYGTQGALAGTTNELKWKYYKPEEAPKLELQREPLSNENGEPIYCQDNLKWYEEGWSSDEDLFGSMSSQYYGMLYAALAEGKPLEVTPQQVRQQAAVIEECQRQNPQIYKR